MWPTHAPEGAAPPLSEVVEALATAPKTALPELVAGWLDVSAPSVRYRAVETDYRRPARRRLGAIGQDRAGRTRRGHRRRRGRGGLARPRAALSFAVRLAGGSRPNSPTRRTRRCSARRCSPTRWKRATSRRWRPRCYRAEWKWDGIRVQLVSTHGGRRLYSRGADDISAAFPEIVEAMEFRRACWTASCW